MKANRKFLNNEDEAVSPVIAVILMVAITVVLAATVYVWVSGFGSQSSQPAKTLALNSAGAIINTDDADDDFTKAYTVASATSGMKYSDLTFTLDGVPLTCDVDGTADTDNLWFAYKGATAVACNALASTVISAGDTITVYTIDSPSGSTFRALDTQANSVIYTITIG